jgi:hypothetical protein
MARLYRNKAPREVSKYQNSVVDAGESAADNLVSQTRRKLMPDSPLMIILDGVTHEFVDQLQAKSPDSDIMTSENFLGGLEASIFVPHVITVLGMLLTFITANRDRLKKGTISIGKDRIDISDMRPDDIQAILDLPAVQALMSGETN